MATVILDYTANLLEDPDFSEIFNKIHKQINAITGIPIYQCQSAASKLENFYVGDGNPKYAFIVCRIFILEGYGNDVLKQLTEAINELLEDYFRESFHTLDLRISVAAREVNMNNATEYPQQDIAPNASMTLPPNFQ